MKINIKIPYRSLQFRLSLTLSLIVLVIGIIATSVSYTIAYEKVTDLQDRQMLEYAKWAQSRVEKIAVRGGKVSVFDDFILRENPQDKNPEGFYIQSLDSSCVVKLFGHPDAASIVGKFKDGGLHTILINHKRWRITLFSFSNKKRYVIAQPQNERENLAGKIAFSGIWSWFFLIPLLWILIAIVARRTFKGVQKQAEMMNRRDISDVSPFPTKNIAPELLDFAHATNGLLQRLNESLSSYRRFIADAAHELRTPVMALSLQTESLKNRKLTQEQLDKEIESLQSSVKRLRDLLQQLLVLARLQGQLSVKTDQMTPVTPVLRTVVMEIYPMAEQKHIDLGVERVDEIELQMTEVSLRAIFKNLIENAVRYTPEHGQVDIYIIHNDEYDDIIIEDTGKGIPAHIVPEVLKPFSRYSNTMAEGSGLGLAIVNEICHQMKAELIFENSSLSDDEDNPGLKVTIRFHHQDDGVYKSNE